MSDASAKTAHPSWEKTRGHLKKAYPSFYEFEPGGALLMDLGGDGWLLEVTPDAQLLCQMGMDMDDIKTLMSEGTPEDLGTDEVAKQAKYYLQHAVSKFRPALRGAGFEESTEMTEEYVATTFKKSLDFDAAEETGRAVGWCRQQFGMSGR